MKRIFLLFALLFTTAAHAEFTVTKAHCDQINEGAAEVIRLFDAGYNRDDNMRNVALSVAKGVDHRQLKLDVYPYVVSMVIVAYSEGALNGARQMINLSVQICPKSIGDTWH